MSVTLRSRLSIRPGEPLPLICSRSQTEFAGTGFLYEPSAVGSTATLGVVQPPSMTGPAVGAAGVGDNAPPPPPGGARSSPPPGAAAPAPPSRLCVNPRRGVAL